MHFDMEACVSRVPGATLSDASDRAAQSSSPSSEFSSTASLSEPARHASSREFDGWRPADLCPEPLERSRALTRAPSSFNIHSMALEDRTLHKGAYRINSYSCKSCNPGQKTQNNVYQSYSVGKAHLIVPQRRASGGGGGGTAVIAPAC